MSIRRFGIQRPVTLLNRQLLDGQTRVRAALKLQRPIPAIDLDVEALGALDPFDFALHANRAAAHGRRLSDTQVALLAVSFEKEWFARCEEDARNRIKAGVKVSHETKGTVLQNAAKRFDVSANRIKQAMAIVATDDPELYGKVFSNELSITAAAELTLLNSTERKAALNHLLASRRVRRSKKGSFSNEESTHESGESAEPPAVSTTSHADANADLERELKCIHVSAKRIGELAERYPQSFPRGSALHHALKSLEVALNAFKPSDP